MRLRPTASWYGILIAEGKDVEEADTKEAETEVAEMEEAETVVAEKEETEVVVAKTKGCFLL